MKKFAYPLFHFVMSLNLQKLKWRGRIVRYAPLFLWIGVVLYASTSAGAMSNTSLVIRPLLHFLFPGTPEETITIYHAFIRKLAHLTEYSILAFWASAALWKSSKPNLRSYWYLFAFLIVAAVASIDEYNQSFDPLRTSSIYDVLLDCAGGAVMIMLCLLYKSKKNSERNNTVKL